MAQPQVKPVVSQAGKRRSSRLKIRAQAPNRTNAATLASILQLREEKRELTYSLLALVIKVGLLFIALSSAFNLAIASHQRVSRNNEIASVLRIERGKLQQLYLRFDSLFSIGGKERLMEEQDQWIMPNSRRIIWR